VLRPGDTGTHNNGKSQVKSLEETGKYAKIIVYGSINDGALAGAGAVVGKLGAPAAGSLPAGAGNKPIAIIAKNGTVIKGFVGHGIDRAIGDAAKRAGTTPQAILDAIKSPRKILIGMDQYGRPFEIFTGPNARVVVNPQTGNIISVNPLSRAGAH